MTLFDDPNAPRPLQPWHGDRPPIVRASDPSTAHTAARLFEPTRDTKVRRVLRYLRARPNVWVDGTELTTPEVGGSEGLRRLREAEARFPIVIEKRPHPGGGTSWQYRLVEDAR